jgi:3-hydroxyacyl-CoA dehydrogenase/3-hydroxy-2-methylbutyryl-CoA dehydrogenase
MLSRTVALVTGGSSGLGAAAVKRLVGQGARVLVADLPSQQELFRKMALQDVAFHATDVTDASQVAASLDEIEKVFGEPVNVLVNCAGIAIARKTLSAKGTPHPVEDFARTLQVNTTGSFTVASLAAKRMSQREPDKDGLRGCIILTASIAAMEGQIGQVAYAASKGGVVGMTLPMARDLAPFGIRVMTIVSYAQFAIAGYNDDDCLLTLSFVGAWPV